MSNYRNRAFLDLLRGLPCQLQVPGVCQSGVNPSMACHSNQQRHGRGFAFKSHDCYAVAGCGPCHQWLDSGSGSRDEKEYRFFAALERQVLALWEGEYVQISIKGRKAA